MKKLLLAVLGMLLYQGAYAQLSSLSLYEYEWSDHSSMFGLDGGEYAVIHTSLKYPRFQGWTHKMVMGYIDDHIAVRQQLDSTDRKPWIAFEDSMFQKGNSFLPAIRTKRIRCTTHPMPQSWKPSDK